MRCRLPLPAAEALARRYSRCSRRPPDRGDRLFVAAASGAHPRQRCPHARPRLRHAQRQGRGVAHQFAGRLGGAIAPHLPAHPGAGGGEEFAGIRRSGGRRGLGRLHARLRRRRDRRRSLLDRRIDRRDRHKLRLHRCHPQARDRAAHLHRRRPQIDARPLRSREGGRRRPAQVDPAGNPRDVHRSRAHQPWRPPERPGRNPVFRANTGPPRRVWSTVSSTG